MADSSRTSSIVTEGDLSRGESESSSKDADVSGDESKFCYDSDSSLLSDDGSGLESELEPDTNSSSTTSSDGMRSSFVSSDSDLDMLVTNSEPNDE